MGSSASSLSKQERDVLAGIGKSDRKELCAKVLYDSNGACIGLCLKPARLRPAWPEWVALCDEHNSTP